MYNYEMVETLILYALLMIKTPYIWGGNNPNGGLDCSGFVLEALNSVVYPSLPDMSSQGLYDHFKANKYRSGLTRGSLLFFGKATNQISHVAIAIDEFSMIEAGGGGRGTLTTKDAIRHNAMVRIRPIKRRKDLIRAILPIK